MNTLDAILGVCDIEQKLEENRLRNESWNVVRSSDVQEGFGEEVKRGIQIKEVIPK